MKKLRTLLRLGGRALWLNAVHRLKLKLGVYARTNPVHDWEPYEGRFVSIFAVPDPDSIGPVPVATLDQLRSGLVPLFSWDWKPMPADWRHHPLTEHDYPKVHWSRISPGVGGDVKFMWEPSRFDWALLLGRHIHVVGDASDRLQLMKTIAGWHDQNRPNEGVNWACGQETSFRMFALMWVATVISLPDSGARTAPPPQGDPPPSPVLDLLPAHAERVEAAIGYALSQHNNHGLSEAAALFLAGHSLPDHPRAAIWREKGKRLFIQEVRSQCTRDGWYCQHSHNYTRVALLDALIAMRTAKVFDDPLPTDVTERFRLAARLLAGICRDGRVPNYGANDGANVLALHGCEYGDFRPITAATLRMCGDPSPFPPGPWDELSAWFGLDTLSPARGEGTPINSKQGGYYVLTKDKWLATIRCHTFTDRPAHADMLHVDLWHGDEPVFIDGGTFSYTNPVGKELKSTKAHNCIAVGGESQMVEGSQFLWLDWTESKALNVGSEDFQGEHYGYRRRFGITHRRHVHLENDQAMIVDSVMGGSASKFEINWRVPYEIVPGAGNSFLAGPFKIDMEAGEGTEMSVSEDAHSRRYGELEKCWRLQIAWTQTNCRVTTKVSLLSEKTANLDPIEPLETASENDPWPPTSDRHSERATDPRVPVGSGSPPPVAP